MTKSLNQLLSELHAAGRSDKEWYNRLVSENLKPFKAPYEMEGVKILGLYKTGRFEYVICCDRGSIIAVNPSDFY